MDNRRMNCPCSDLQVSSDCEIHDHSIFEPICPKCSSKPRDRQTYSTWAVLYECGTGQSTIGAEKKLFYGGKCYETQLSAQATLLREAKDRIMDLEEALGREVSIAFDQSALLREAKEVVGKVAEAEVLFSTYQIPHPSLSFVGLKGSEVSNLKTKAQALLPKLEAVVKEKP
jgi:hypothetical protein